jgi:hypothetical protein
MLYTPESYSYQGRDNYGQHAFLTSYRSIRLTLNPEVRAALITGECAWIMAL